MRFIYSRAFTKLFIAFVLVSAFIISDALGYLTFVKSGFHTLYGSATFFVSSALASTKNFLSSFLLIKRLSYENDLLNQKIDELAFENAKLKIAKGENLALRKALSFVEQSEFVLTPVSVKSADPTGFTQTVVIDRGNNSQLTAGMAVISAPGLLVGKISKVYDRNSEVTLITDPAVTINAEVADSAALGLVVGEHGLSLKFDLVTHNEVIKPGDQILTSGLANDFPKGLLVGEITSISSSASDLFQKAFVTPAANLRNLKFLFVVK